MVRLALSILFVLLLAGCGAAGAPTGEGSTTSPTTTSAPANASQPATVSAAPAAPQATAAPAGMSLEPGSAEEKAAQALARKLGVAVDTLRLTAKGPQEWSDGSLGCPAPGMMYTQAIVPGFKFTFSDGTKTYDVHTDESGVRAVLCQNKQPADLEGAEQ